MHHRITVHPYGRAIMNDYKQNNIDVFNYSQIAVMPLFELFAPPERRARRPQSTNYTIHI